MYRCELCRKPLKDGAKIVPVLKYVVNEKRGDFATSQPTGYLHLNCMIRGGN